MHEKLPNIKGPSPIPPLGSPTPQPPHPFTNAQVFPPLSSCTNYPIPFPDLSHASLLSHFWLLSFTIQTGMGLSHLNIYPYPQVPLQLLPYLPVIFKSIVHSRLHTACQRDLGWSFSPPVLPGFSPTHSTGTIIITTFTATSLSALDTCCLPSRPQSEHSCKEHHPSLLL